MIQTVTEAEAVTQKLCWWRGWAPLVLLPVSVLWLSPQDWPRWELMWLLAGAVYFSAKWLTWRRTPTSNAPLWMHLAYLFAWPGMDAAAFLDPESTQIKRPDLGEWLFAWAKLSFGCLVFFGLARWMPADIPYLTGWSGLVGLAFILHFGTFHLLSCWWRGCGIAAAPLMDWPIASQSPSAFWGQRWNRAFRDLTNRFLFRPLARFVGSAWALAIGFLVSGLIHDIVISLPAQGGYGRPTLYFVIQGIAILMSRSPLGRKLVLPSGVTGWLYTFAVVVLPACLLFHPPFVENIILPFMTAVGALP